ncbi:MAG: DegT/DnrJ/EryC1/StrS family aminotransferase [Treponema sp.]|nr:DegT/DnrJ/EryC1/StrS family aminotransferase [Treponema sp.]
MKLKTPLYDAIMEYAKKNPTRFHMPGHQGVVLDKLYSSAGADITRLSVSDDLLYPKHVIKEAETLAREAYGTTGTLFVTAGATLAVFIAVGTIALKTSAKKVILNRNSHKSAFSALRLFGLTPCFCNTKSDNNGFVKPAEVHDIETLLNTQSGIAAVFITSPDYFGRTAEVEKIANLVHERGVFLIVDGAHGPHFNFSGLLPPHSAKYADVVIDSCHKTMPVYTGGAMVHVNGEELYKIALLRRVGLHTTSPQYLTLASLDYARARMMADGEAVYKNLLNALKEFNHDIEADNHYSIDENDDFSRLVINCNGFSGSELGDELEKYGVFIEMSYGSRVICILSPYNTGALKVLSNALNKITLTRQAREIDFPPVNYEEWVDYGVTGNIKFLPLKECEGKICGTEIGIYPPGVPAVVRGERITAGMLNYLTAHQDRLFGLVESMVCIIEDK